MLLKLLVVSPSPRCLAAAAAAKNYETTLGKVLCVWTPDPTVVSPTPDEQCRRAVCRGEFPPAWRGLPT